MDVFELAEMVEGSLLWIEYDYDLKFNQEAWHIANLMVASGNYKKADVMEFKKGLYKSLDDREEEKKPKADVKKDYEEEKAKLLKAFKINPETT